MPIDAVVHLIVSCLVIASFVYLASRVSLAVRPVYALAFFIVFPVLSMPLWAAFSDAPPFSWVKTYSVCLSAALVLSLKLMSEKWQRRLYPIAYLIIFLNILELVVSEYLRTNGLLNPLAGLLLLVSLPLPRHFSVSKTSRDVRYDVSWTFLIGYTLWNFTGVYNLSFGEGVLFAFIHLTIALLLTRGRSELYYQARSISLALIMVYRMYADMLPLHYNTPGWYSPSLSLWLSVASFTVAGLAVALRFAPALRDSPAKASNHNTSPHSASEADRVM